MDSRRRVHFLMIRGLRARGYNLTLNAPVETASGIMQSTPLVLLDLFSEEGVTGCAYVRTYTPTALPALVRFFEDVAPLIVGEALEPGPLQKKLLRHFRLLGVQGLAGIVIAAIDMALWDMAAKIEGLPLATMLGGTANDVLAYASLRTMEAGRAAREAAEHVEAGFRAVKVKVGGSDLARDLSVIREIRAAVGEDVRIMVDYNQSLTVQDAIDRARALDAENIYWIEEPTRADDYQGHARIASAVQTPIQLGENAWGAHDVEKMIAASASDHLMFDVMKYFGVTGWMQAAHAAQRAGLPISSHTFPEFSVHLLSATRGAHYLEYLDHAGVILQQPVAVQDGYALVPQSPGAGIAWDETRLRSLATTG